MLMKKIAFAFLTAALLAVGVNAAFEKVNTYDNNFSDVKDTNWFSENVKTAYELGFMNGKSEGKFDPDGSITVAEGITMASRLHAIYNGMEIKPKAASEKEYRIDFDDPSIIFDSTKRNSRYESGVDFHRSTGYIDNGILVVQPDAPNDRGIYDPGVIIKGFDLDTRVYNKLTFRMKRDVLDNVDPDAPRSETVEIYFGTSTSSGFASDKCVTVSLEDVEDKTNWFEFEVDLFRNKKYTDFLREIRFDPTNNNGIYYIDYITFSTSENYDGEKWYDVYVDYALDNGIFDLHEFTRNDFERNLTRSELCDLFASALPNEYFNAINDINGIPDVSDADKNADVYLMLYRAGILLGSDGEGTFNGSSNIKRSEAAAIINRVALPENRVKGSVSAVWKDGRTSYDIEFNDEKYLETLTYEAESVKIQNGALVLKVLDRGPERKPRFDPKITVKNLDIDAHKYSNLRIRMKPEFEGEIINSTIDFYFMTEGDDNFSETKSLHLDFDGKFKDSAGWYVFEFDFRLLPVWDGKVTAFRFDPANTNGTFYVDYIRFVSDEENYYSLFTHDELVEAGYTSIRLMRDEGFERGFYVSRVQNTASSLEKGLFRDYVETNHMPLWNISPHWARFDLVDDRDTATDKYTIKDKHDVNTITYNPEEKSLTMRVNTYPIYEGKPHIDDEYTWWPHLLVSQDSGICPIDKKRNSAAADRMFVEIDIRLLDFENTTITDGTTSANFMAYFYLRTDKAPGQLIWFGLNFFNGIRVDNSTKCGWAPDSAAHQYMYKMSQGIVFGGVENSFVPENGIVLTGEEWKHVRVDVTPHIKQAVEWANRDNAFGTPVTVEDMYFEGVNIGYETWGNFDYTVEFKNFNMVSYNKAE